MRIWSLLYFLFVALGGVSLSAADPWRGMTVASDIKASDIAVLKSWNVNVVRYPLSWHIKADTATETEYFAWLSGALDAFDAILPVLTENGIKVNLTLYTPPGGFVTHSSPSQHRVFSEAWAQSALRQVWNIIATRYKDNAAIIAYTLMNEPAQHSVASGLLDWNSLAEDLTQQIRFIDPVRTLVVLPPYGNQALLRNFRPVSVSNVMYGFHIYYPTAFNHQGFNRAPINVSYPSKKCNKRALQKSLAMAQRFQKMYGVSILVDEFSAVRWAPKNSAYRYLRDFISIFEKNSWSWIYHAFREADPWSVEHGSNPKNHTPQMTPTNRQVLLRSYFSKNTVIP